MEKIRIGIIGCGIITKESHVPALKRLSDKAEVIAVCNRTRSKAEVIAEDFNLPGSAIWTDWEEMIKNVEDMDVVLVALPMNMNHLVSKACCKAGLNVLCEKPAAMSIKEAEETAEFSNKYGVTYMTGENFHYISHITKAVELIEKGLIGYVHSIVWNQFQYLNVDNEYNKTVWRSKNKHPGGYILDGGVHSIHALQMIAGSIKSVYSKTKSIESGIGDMDTSLSILEHENGIVTSLNLGWRGVNDDTNLKIYGDKGTLIVKEQEGIVVHLTPEDESKDYVIDNESSFYLEWKDYLNAISTKSSPGIPPLSTVHDVKVILAAVESGKSGKTVII